MGLVLGMQPAHHRQGRMAGIDFEGAAHRAGFLLEGPHDLLHLHPHVPLVPDQTAGAVGETLRKADIADPVAKFGLDGLQQLLVVGRRLFLIGLLGLLLFRGIEIGLALVDRLQILALVRRHVLHHPFIDRIGEEDHFIALGPESLEMRRILQHRQVLAGDVVDVLLRLGHAIDILLQRDQLAGRGLVRLEQQQLLDLLAVLQVEMDPFLQHRAEFLPERQVFLARSLFHLLQGVESLFDQVLADLEDLPVLLQHFARDIERQVGGIDDPAQETEVLGHQRFAVVGDEDPADIELDAMFAAFGVEHLERRLFRDEQQGLELAGSLGAPMDGFQGFLEIVADVLVEFGVFLGGDLGCRPLPDGAPGIDGLEIDLFQAILVFDLGLQHHRMLDKIGEFLDDLADLPLVQVFLRLFAQVQDDFGAAGRLGGGIDAVAAFASAFPMDRLVGGMSGAQGGQLDLGRHHEGGIEADAELADQFRRQWSVGLLHLLQEPAGPGTGNGSDVGFDFLLVHPDAVVDDGQGFGFGIGNDLDLPVAIAIQQGLVRDGLETDTIDGIGGIRDQLAQENILVGVERMDDQVEQLGYLGLELVVFGSHESDLLWQYEQELGPAFPCRGKKQITNIVRLASRKQIGRPATIDLGCTRKPSTPCVLDLLPANQ